jgi:hypothetical protein
MTGPIQLLRIAFVLGRMQHFPRLVNTLVAQGMSDDEIFLLLVSLTCEE